MPKMVMNQGHEYMIRGKLVRAGEEFDCPDADAHLWELFGRAARVVDEDKRKRAPRYNRRDMRAEDE